MNPMLLYMAGSVVAAGFGAIGSWLAGSKDEEERRQRELALQEYAGMQPPEVRELIANEVAGSRMSQVRRNDGQRAIREEAQGRFMDVGRSGGLDLNARARLEEANLEAGQQERANRDAILADYQARGLAGSGEELALRLGSQQGAAERARMAGVQASADAETRALEALARGEDIAASMENEDWQRDASVASAEDDIAMFNAGERNRFSLYNDQQRWDRHNAQMDLATARANARNGVANSAARAGDRTRQTWAGVGQGVGYGLTAGAQYASQNPPKAAPPAQAPKAQPTQKPVQPTQQQQPAAPTRRRAM